MKKILFLSVIVFCTAKSFAQPRNTTLFNPSDFKKTLKGALLNITADKYVAETKESVKLTVTMDIFDDDGNAQRLDYRPQDPATAPWFVKNWKIVEGGGRLTSSPASGNDYYAVLITPEKIPLHKCVIVEVTMHALDKNYPETILRQSIYIEDNENVFYVNCPTLNIKQEKWVIKNTGGASMQIPNVQGAKNNPGLNIEAATSNCKAIYSKEENTTAITLMGGIVSAIDGKLMDKKNNFLITISVPGRGMSNFKIKDKKNISVAFTLPLLSQACSCDDDPEWKAEREKNEEKGPTCSGGFISIDEVVFGKNGFIKGHFRSNLEGNTTDGAIFYADVEGKFKAKLVN